VILVAGDHSLRSSVAVAEAVAGWLGGLKP
jgi:hypothetical protein